MQNAKPQLKRRQRLQQLLLGSVPDATSDHVSLNLLSIPVLLGFETAFIVQQHDNWILWDKTSPYKASGSKPEPQARQPNIFQTDRFIFEHATIPNIQNMLRLEFDYFT